MMDDAGFVVGFGEDDKTAVDLTGKGGRELEPRA